ncbi:hypothetical protein [Engelhardtia mirabilis]|uniref:Uncharacterized protein n=1 Tax=Engelhardtia mirabilis TaxID=2528011 RepID=A0A518BGM8_9BACT|nr:hypothetical protein Pla133_12080 [Planctomycetes bacterium Pla133]QDV00469.1 hypothetical protein Pla86_12080 [Planctomycetes bacterium Pla86]
MPQRDIKSEISDRLNAVIDELYDLIAAAASDAVQEVLGTAGSSSSSRGTVKRSTKKRSAKKGASKKRSTKKRSAKKSASKKRGTKKSGRRVRRSTADVEAVSSAIAAQLRQTPGVSVSELAASMGADSVDLKRPIALMLDAGKIRKTGAKRGTKYFAKGRK